MTDQNNCLFWRQKLVASPRIRTTHLDSTYTIFESHTYKKNALYILLAGSNETTMKMFMKQCSSCLQQNNNNARIQYAHWWKTQESFHRINIFLCFGGNKVLNNE